MVSFKGENSWAMPSLVSFRGLIQNFQRVSPPFHVQSPLPPGSFGSKGIAYLQDKTENYTRYRGGSGGRMQEVHPPPTWDDQRLSNTTGVYVQSPVSYAIP